MGSPISTLLEADCRESIKRPIGETAFESAGRPMLDASSRVFSCQAFDQSVGVRLGRGAPRALRLSSTERCTISASGKGQTAIARSRLLFNQANDRIRRPACPACFRQTFVVRTGRRAEKAKTGGNNSAAEGNAV